MDMILKTTANRSDGIFSQLLGMSFNYLFTTGEHAYPITDPTDPNSCAYAPKIVRGQKYKCVRGMHRLESMTEDFETFEITGVEGHTKLLFHWGNWPQIDSLGCVLVANRLGPKADGGLMVCDSRNAFAKFMDMQKGVDEFWLTVE